MNPMGLSDHWVDSLEILSLQPVKIFLGMNPMGFS